MINDGWFDAHLDLAYLHFSGRNMHANPEDAGGKHQPAGVTLPSLRAGAVRYALGTIYTEADGKGAYAYARGDKKSAREAGVKQLDWYRRQMDAGVFAPLSEHLDQPPPDGVIALGILLENADPIKDADDLAWWTRRGIVAVGMAWMPASRFAGGNNTTQGITPAGRELVQAIDELGIIHDLSHLSQEASDELLTLTDHAVMASHSNCRALLGGTNARHLSDETIAEVGRRGGVIGLNLCRNFIRGGLLGAERPTAREAVAHVEHISGLVENRTCVGLGSDLDGGFSALDLPQGISCPADYSLLDRHLSDLDWRAEERAGFQRENWLRFFRANLQH